MGDEKLKILLVDDDEIQHSIVTNMLSDEYDFFCAKSGNEALTCLYNSGFVPNIVLLDILMPEMDGWEVFNRIRAITLLKNVPIVFITSMNEATDEERAFELGAADFIQKPYDKDNLLSRIKKALEKRSANL